MRTKTLVAISALSMLLGMPQAGKAFPGFLEAFNAKYGTAATRLNTCFLCHKSPVPSLNPYGLAVLGQISRGVPIATALTRIQRVDSDKDHFTNIKEIRARKFPGKKRSHP
jgi:hypothetical protein